MIAGIVMQAVVFTEGASSRWDLNWDSLLPKAIVYNLVGFAVILLLLYVDYNFIAKYAYELYGFYLFGLVEWLVAAEINRWVTPSITTYYGLHMLFPIVFAGIYCTGRLGRW